MSVIVFGSINMDLTVRVKALPRPGETLLGHAFATAPGGKGANQAVAAARLGAATRMVCRVGADAFGQTLREGLVRDGVGTEDIAIDASAPSGVALITVAETGENTIVVAPGANERVGEDDLAALSQALDGAAVLLLQLEIPLEAVVAAARLARERGVFVVLDPAPAQMLPDELYKLVDLLTPNANETATLLDRLLPDDGAVIAAAQELQQRGARAVLLKRGEHGAYLLDETGTGSFVDAYKVAAVDAVAAGDAVNGAVAAALDAGHSLVEAVRWGMAAGALTTTRHGAQPSLPRRDELEGLLARG